MSFVGATLWNILPPHVKSTPTLLYLVLRLVYADSWHHCRSNLHKGVPLHTQTYAYACFNVCLHVHVCHTNMPLLIFIYNYKYEEMCNHTCAYKYMSVCECVCANECACVYLCISIVFDFLSLLYLCSSAPSAYQGTVFGIPSMLKMCSAKGQKYFKRKDGTKNATYMVIHKLM